MDRQGACAETSRDGGNKDLNGRRHVYIIVKDSGNRQIAFVRFERGHVVVDERSFREAKVFNNEAAAKGIACDLNSRRYGDGGWYVRDYYI